MDRDSLYNKIIAIVPVKPQEDYRTVVRKSLKIYFETVSELDESDKPPTWQTTMSRLTQLCDGINRAIELEYKGVRHSAYSAIKNQLDGYKNKSVNITALALENNLSTINSDSIFYRMRKVSLEEQRGLKGKDLFHVPLDKRTLVTTQRFSVPGYPCLYLSHRVYGCWEEMGRPDFGTIMVSSFKSVVGFKVLDLRIPSKKIWNENMESCILFFPLVISTMVQVQKPLDPYKPEYTISQMLTEWIISHNRAVKVPEVRIIGIAYTSAQKNYDFEYPDDSYDNFAIPVLEPLTSKYYCNKLKELFNVTAPTYYDLEVLKQGEYLDAGEFGLSGDEQKKNNINISHFGIMERYLSRYEFHKLED